MDKLGKRAQLLEALPDALNRAAKKQKETTQLSFLSQEEIEGEESEVLPDIEEWPSSQILAFEKELLGFYVTSHPLADYNWFLDAVGIIKIKDIIAKKAQSECSVAVVIDKVKLITTRKTSELMAIIRIEDDTSSMEGFVFPSVYRENADIIKKGNLVFLRGRINIKDNYPKLLVSEVMALAGIADRVKSLVLSLDKNNTQVLKQLKSLLSRYQGNIPVYFDVIDGYKRARIKAGNEFFVNLQPDFFAELSRILDKGKFNLTLG
jgi:DNA polymerase-3 subunit alpha